MENISALNEREAAAMLGCSIALLRKWRLFGEGPTYIKLGRRLVRYRQEDLTAFLDAHMVTGSGR